VVNIGKWRLNYAFYNCEIKLTVNVWAAIVVLAFKILNNCKSTVASVQSDNVHVCESGLAEKRSG